MSVGNSGRVVHGSNDAQLVGHFRGVRQQLGEVHARHIGFDRSIRADLLG